MMRPCAPIDGSLLQPLPGRPEVATLTRVVVRRVRSRTNTSSVALPSRGTRSVAGELNATYRPSALIAETLLWSFPGRPEPDTLTSVVRPARRSRTKTSTLSLTSPRTRSGASDR